MLISPKQILIVSLLCSFLLLFFPPKSYAGYPSLLKNGFIDEVDSGAGQNKTNQDNKIKEKRRANDKTGKFSIGVAGGYSTLLGFNFDSLLIGANIGYWINNRIQAGLDFLYHIKYENSNPGEDEGLSSSGVSIMPRFKICILGGSFTPAVEFGLGSFSSWTIYESETDPTLDLGIGFDYYPGGIFSTGINIKTYILPDSDRAFLIMGFWMNYLF